MSEILASKTPSVLPRKGVDLSQKIAKRAISTLDVSPSSKIEKISLSIPNIRQEHFEVIESMSDTDIDLFLSLKKDYGISLQGHNLSRFQKIRKNKIKKLLDDPNYSRYLRFIEEKIDPVFGEKNRQIGLEHLEVFMEIDESLYMRLEQLQKLSFFGDTQDWMRIKRWGDSKYSLFVQLIQEGIITNDDRSKMPLSEFDTEIKETDTIEILKTKKPTATLLFLYDIKKIFSDFQYIGGEIDQIGIQFSNYLIGKYPIQNNPEVPVDLYINRLFRFGDTRDVVVQTSENCYLAAALWSLTRNGSFQKSLQENLTNESNEDIFSQKWMYTFPNKKSFPVQRKDFRIEKRYSNIKKTEEKIAAIKGPIGYKILESAYVQLIDSAPWKREKLGRYGSQGGSAEEVLQKFLLDTADICNLSTKSHVYQIPILHGFNILNSGGSIITAGIRNNGTPPRFEYKGYKLARGHVYSITKFDTKTQIVTVINPWNTSNTMEFGLTEFMHIFDNVTIAFLKK
ncbi:hypothetical protein HOO68_03325 [Candidatus Gracilibacteria bacterium]|nr:hypothetical protein [Candidatus Gracilibacteria bacterium]